MSAEQILKDLARVKALFQARAIAASMGIDPDSVKVTDDKSTRESDVVVSGK